MKEPQYRGVNELRRMFLDFFESKGHLVMKSFSLVPHNDNSLLLINSGMAPLKPYFTGQEIPPRRRVATCQKCIRTGDIENIGKTARHGTFFEMLGNFSFGDYFKTEAIHWSWEFLTEVVGLDPDRLYPSVYLDDDEAFDIWNKEVGIPAERIFRFGKEDNFWEHGSGPCGPCSEIYYDRGEKFGCGKPGCTVGCDCDRYIEVWNNVFSQFDNDGHGNYSELKQKNIDTGMGLERLAVVVQGVDSLFTVDTNKALLDRVCQLAGKEYQKDHETDVSLRIVTDHIKSCTFMISDGIMPSNEGRGYVLRRLLRRAARHGRKLGIEGKFLADLSTTVIELSKDGYPELEEKQAMILKVLSEEEDKFNKTIDQGLSILGDMEAEMQTAGEKSLSGANAFKLYDTYGFPLDLTKEILEERGYTVDEDGFAAAMKEQKEKARKARKTTNYMGADVTVYQSIDAAVTSEFVGYDQLEASSTISVLTTEDEIVEALTDGQRGTIIADQTPFYGTMGGQQGDVGTISSPNGEFKVEETIHLQGSKIGHVGVMTKGMLRVGEKVNLKVCAENRQLTCKNHSATHLLQKALRMVLGDHVEQAGSYVDAGRLRFDFTHFSAMTPEEIKKTEELVNREIQASLPVVTEVMSLDEAKKTGAMALFGEKYGEKVRVVKMGDFSVELCGGTHVSNTSSIASFKILSETGIAAGVRRIEALTSQGLIRHYEEVEEQLHQAAKTAKTTPAALNAKIESLLEEIRSLSSENEKLKNKLANESLGDVASQVKEIEGLKVLATKVDGVDMNGLRNLGDQMKNQLGECVVVMASVQDGKVNLMATATDGAQKRGAHAGNLIKAIAGLVGGGGGGRPGMAQAGGKNPAGIDEALEKALETVKEQIVK
ncbi:MAG: alanine--tRNA ligase [Lachnospiraceae bacterium]|uniref:Alanine--tRNA ligase n=1 Tax=Candidatus Enterocloster excrementigallinarum TaxID=2838558 RepID=A0A9D2PS10_9FIRM|nr:alanine--tRNA ligase [Lachnospiraceae bacterium]HJC66059.1 alanine--tRNA ligase [Candidatus Enterocloster excrementigallinarum]